jgi:hypothetical protein
MTKFPEKTRCSHGGFGQNRLDKCDATKSKSGKHRNFHDSSAFIEVVRGMLNTRTFGDGDGEEEEDRHLTEAEVLSRRATATQWMARAAAARRSSSTTAPPTRSTARHLPDYSVGRRLHCCHDQSNVNVRE